MTGTSLLFAMLFGAVGAGYFVYGRKEQEGITMMSGVALCVFPYFVHQPLLVVVVGVVLLAVPWVLRS